MMFPPVERDLIHKGIKTEALDYANEAVALRVERDLIHKGIKTLAASISFCCKDAAVERDLIHKGIKTHTIIVPLNTYFSSHRKNAKSQDNNRKWSRYA